MLPSRMLPIADNFMVLIFNATGNEALPTSALPSMLAVLSDISMGINADFVR